MEEITQGQIISHYKIIEKLGEGGMGVVYKAEDNKLKRIAALKFLPPLFSLDAEAKTRFIHEAQSASALDHPNICTVYEINETENGRSYISIAYYEGETLKSKIEKGKIESEEAVKIILQIAEGLKAAHERNIIHRDIKPANIFITDKGIVKILDFGLAKIQGRTQLTQIGTTVGTCNYMSPEQAKGEEVDQRTDIWSLGIVIYEMLTGNLPFKADYDQAIIYSILNENPDITNIPSEFQPVIKKAIVKSTGERYQKIEELINDLEQLTGSLKSKGFIRSASAGFYKTGSKIKLIYISVFILLLAAFAFFYFNIWKKEDTQVTAAKSRKMIVVLPFENLGSPDDEYLSEGIRDEISNKLASLASIGVISRNSAEKYAKSDKSIKEIGKELGVDYILEGTIRWAKNNSQKSRIRIIPQLVRVSDDISIWSESFDKIIDDIFNVQNEIAQNVVDKLGIKLLPNQSVTGPPPTKNLEAYDYYLKAYKFGMTNSTNDDILTCVKLYEKAVDLDSGFALARDYLSIAYMAVYTFIDHDIKYVNKAAEHLQKAKEINPGLAENHLADAFYNVWIKNDYQSALQEFKKTIEIQPSNSEANFWIGGLLEVQGKTELALEYKKRASELDPLIARYIGDIGETYFRLKDYKNSEKYYRKAIELSPEVSYYYIGLANYYLARNGDIKKAEETLKNIKDDVYLEEYENMFIYLSILERKYDKALSQLRSSKKEYLNNSYGAYIPNTQMIAFVYKYKNEPQLSEAYFDTSRIELERLIKKNPEDARFKFALCVSYAGLGYKEKVYNLYSQLTGIKINKTNGINIFGKYKFLLTIYILLGENEKALKQIDFLLSNQTDFYLNKLQLDPFYDPLRNLPGYKAIIEKYSAE